MEQMFVGIDVAKDRLDVHYRPSGEAFAVALAAGPALARNAPPPSPTPPLTTPAPPVGFLETILQLIQTTPPGQTVEVEAARRVTSDDWDDDDQGDDDQSS